MSLWSHGGSKRTEVAAMGTKEAFSTIGPAFSSPLLQAATTEGPQGEFKASLHWVLYRNVAELHSLGLKAQRYGCRSEQCFCRDSCIEKMRKQNVAPANDAKTSGGWYVAKQNALGVPALSGVETTLLPGREEGAVKSRHALMEQIPLEAGKTASHFAAIPTFPSSPALLHQ